MSRSTRSAGSAAAEPAHRVEHAGGESRVPGPASGPVRKAGGRRPARVAAKPEDHELLEGAFAEAPIGIALVELDGRCIKVNAAAGAVTGWPTDELLTKRLRDFTHPDDLDTDLNAIEALTSGRISSFRQERRLITRAGAPVWVLLSVALVRDDRRRPRHFIVQMQDISHAKEAQRQLEQAEAAARAERDHATAIVTAMGEGYVLTLDAEIKAVNDALCQLTGFPASALIGSRPPYPFWPPEQVDAIMAVLAAILRDNGGAYEIVLMRADGERFEAEVTSRPAREEDGRAIGYVTTLRDVSVQKRQQRELERMATTDQLTRLANRHVLQQALEREAGRRSTDKRQLALVLLDVDEFKQVNDALGHPAGDAVLVEIARRLESTVRAGEVLARVGGEEFAWLLPASCADEAIAAADRAREAIASQPFGLAGRLTMSAGVGLVSTPSDGDALYRMADRALYEAKQSGRDRTCCHGGLQRGDGRLARVI
ncbi:MAG: diguanylate cyclase [Solirubrobacteraceae bacterium]